MADNFTITQGIGTTIRAVEKSSKKHQVVVLDKGGADAESLFTGAVEVAAIGTTSDAAVTTDATATLNARLRGLVNLVADPTPSEVEVTEGVITIDNAGGAVAVNIQDGGNVITVDGTVTANATLGAETTKVIGTVNIASSQTIGIAAGSASIGKLAANSGVDIGDVDVTSSALPTGAATETTLGTVHGHVDSIDGKITACNTGAVVLAAGTAAVGKLAANSGVDIGDVDVTSIAAGTNTIGGTRDAGPAWTSVWGASSAAVVSNDMTTAAAVTDAPTGGQKIVLDDIVISVAVAMNVLVEEETSGTDLFKIYLPANGTVQITPRGKMKLATADKKVTCKASVAGAITVTATYHSEA